MKKFLTQREYYNAAKCCELHKPELALMSVEQGQKFVKDCSDVAITKEKLLDIYEFVGISCQKAEKKHTAMENIWNKLDWLEREVNEMKGQQKIQIVAR